MYQTFTVFSALSPISGFYQNNLSKNNKSKRGIVPSQANMLCIAINKVYFTSGGFYTRLYSYHKKDLNNSIHVDEIRYALYNIFHRENNKIGSRISYYVYQFLQEFEPYKQIPNYIQPRTVFLGILYAKTKSLLPVCSCRLNVQTSTEHLDYIFYSLVADVKDILYCVKFRFDYLSRLFQNVCLSLMRKRNTFESL